MDSNMRDMGATGGYGRRIDAAVARYFDGDIPESRDLPWYLSPLPEWLENVGLRLAWPIIIINLAGTAFGFWYYSVQIASTPLVMWPIVPVSPLATLYIALSLAAWRLGYSPEWLHTLAFFGCLKYGLWTVFVQVYQGQGATSFALWQFLIWSHAAMVIQAFLIYRYAEFPVWAVGVATGWFTLNDLLDYFVPIFDGPHHTWVSGLWDGGMIDRSLPLFDYMAAVAVTMTILATFLALATRVKLLERRHGKQGSG